MDDWQNATHYHFCEDLQAEEWAWQFLRRNPEYRSDWQWFHAIWTELETEYGSPPQRDFQQWKNDPRAYREAVNEQGDSELLLIECWMGLKWGFYKFPIDPNVTRPQPGAELHWRLQSTLPRLVTKADVAWLGEDHAKVAYGFDLTLPLTAQCEQAQRYLRLLQRERSKQGRICLEIPQLRCHDWIRYLRYLDAESANAPLEKIKTVLSLDEPTATRQQAHEMIRTGYRRILQVSTNINNESL